MDTLRLSFMFTARRAVAEAVSKVLATIQDILVNLTYFGWRPSVAYFSGKRRRATF